MTAAAHPGRARDPYGWGSLFILAWPAACSYLLNSAYRITDQYWVKGLGAAAQSAIGAVQFVSIMNFALSFLAAGGALALVSRALGAGDLVRADQLTRHALAFAAGLGILGTFCGPLAVPKIVELLGLSAETAEHARDYLGSLYALSVPMFIGPTLDSILVARGRSRLSLVLQLTSVGLNFLLNPLLIYGGASAAILPDAPLSGFFSSLASSLDLGRHGVSGAAVATGLARGAAVLIGLACLRFLLDVRLFRAARPSLPLVSEVARLSSPVSLSIALYAGVYWTLLALVLSRLPNEVKAGLGIGFQVFEGLSYPLYLGLSIACAALVGRALGAGDRQAAERVVHNGRGMARTLAILAMCGFWTLARPVAAHFTQDPMVLREAVLYVTCLGFSQYFVAVESLNEKILIGAGLTRSIPLIAGIGNLSRIPLAYLLAIGLDFGAAGLWWAINLTSALKAFLFWRKVQSGTWLERLGARPVPAASKELG